ncbi:MAG: DNA alkylation repair protein [Anaerolineales bacterium]|nr:DNA alkylation repair protein [Anaerolineales bacterium]
MPAIQPARLAAQTVELTEHFDSPEKFVAALHDMLDFYADRTLRPGQVIESAPLLNSYQVAKPVLRHIERGLAEKVNADPEAALALADKLWRQRWVETRLLAIFILGRIPPHPPERVTERAQAWGLKCREDKIVKALASAGIARLRSESRDAFIELLENWLTSSERRLMLIGLRALLSLLEIDGFENLPQVFRWIAPLIREADREIRDDLIVLVRLLARRSPRETAYFLRQALAATANPQTAKIIRRTLDELPEEMSSTLRLELRERRDAEK